MNKKYTKWVFRTFLFIFLLICFSITSYESLVKWWERKTSFSETYASMEKPEPLPTFSLCSNPAFDTKLMTQLNIPSNMFFFTGILGELAGHNTFPNLTQNANFTLEHIWNQTIVKPSVFAIQNTFIQNDEFLKDSGDVETFEVINSLWYGRCTSIVPKRSSRAKEKLLMVFAFSNVVPEELIILLHETPGSRYSLVPGDYVSKGTTEVRFKPGQLTDLGVSKEIKTLKIDRKEGKCQDYLGTDSQSKCYLKILAEKFQRVSEIEGCQDVKICWIPQVKNILKEDVNQCLTKMEYECMQKVLKTDPVEMNVHCPQSCTHINYRIQVKSLPQDMTQHAILLMYYTSNGYLLFEEYFVFDEIAIIVALGGSLGLFLGFSCYQCFDSIALGIVKLTGIFVK